ncbi:MAG: VOC family protein [Candidatus Dojkabacteria bacterium]|nr:MAG: VOC family protein [Candidatus Dojkabacteria bacterium]
MKSHLYHIQLNIDFANRDFYKELMEFMGWSVIFEKPESTIGFRSETNGDLWFIHADHQEDTDYDARGMNHIAIRVENQADINQIQAHLESNGVKMLFGTPLHRPEFASKEGETYYQIMFESPDKILWEIVYIGAKCG